MPVVEKAAHVGRAIERHCDTDVIDCQNCGFKHIDPIPSEAELRKIYELEFYDSDWPEYLAKVEREIEYWNSVFADRFDAFEAHLKTTGRRILDVGCSGGFFLTFGKSRGWDVLGIEPGRQAAEAARRRGIEVIEDLVDNVDLPAKGPFDVVHLAFVLEHLPDPCRLVSEATKALAPGGLLCVEVPNEFNLLQKLVREQRGKEPWWVYPRHHINYFDAPSLRGLLERAGLEVVEQTATWPMEWFLLMGDDYVGNDPLGRECHGKRMKLDIALSSSPEAVALKRDFYRALSSLGIGREVVQFGRKPGAW